MKNSIRIAVFLLLWGSLSAQDLQPFELSDTWLSKIEAIAPLKTRLPVAREKNILIFSLFTGFEHWTIPHTEAVMKLLAGKSKAYNLKSSRDIREFEKDNIAKYDAIILNNNCSLGDRRNLFWDKLKEDSTLTDVQRSAKALQLENNLLEYVERGGGLMILHGAIVMQNKSPQFGKMVGGSFDYHPKQQKINVKLVSPDHDLVTAFRGKGFEHVDEPYFFNNSYFDYNFRPLLYMETNELQGLKTQPRDSIKYISWIKRHGKGRIFYSSPSHNAQSFENPALLQFLLDGLQYVAGDLKCDDSPIGPIHTGK